MEMLMNQATDMVAFSKAYMKLATSKGIAINEERLEIYFYDLSDFPLAHVLETMEWARRNLTLFPTIAELRIYLEGNDEDHANKAWDALQKMLTAGAAHADVTLTDVIMAKTILQTWDRWDIA
jgi:hypothetical protein